MSSLHSNLIKRVLNVYQMHGDSSAITVTGSRVLITCFYWELNHPVDDLREKHWHFAACNKQLNCQKQLSSTHEHSCFETVKYHKVILMDTIIYIFQYLNFNWIFPVCSYLLFSSLKTNNWTVKNNCQKHMTKSDFETRLILVSNITKYFWWTQSFPYFNLYISSKYFQSVGTC